LERFPKGVQLAFAIVPEIATLQEPLRTEIRAAFGESVSVIWKVLTAILSLGFFASLWMADVPMHDLVDQKWVPEE
jgi:hypothetical protein